jgi:hypothetical protein
VTRVTDEMVRRVCAAGGVDFGSVRYEVRRVLEAVETELEVTRAAALQDVELWAQDRTDLIHRDELLEQLARLRGTP